MWQATRLKVEAKLGLFGGLVESVTPEDQISVITVPELDKSGEAVRQMGRSQVTCFPYEQDPLRGLFKFAGKTPDYLKVLLTDKTGHLNVRVEKLIHGHLKTGDEYSTNIDEDEEPFYNEARNIIATLGPIPTEYRSICRHSNLDPTFLNRCTKRRNIPALENESKAEPIEPSLRSTILKCQTLR